MSNEVTELLAAQLFWAVQRKPGPKPGPIDRKPLMEFVRDSCHVAPGQMILFAEFYERFVRSLAPDIRTTWPKMKVSQNLPLGHPSGGATGNRRYVANLSWEPATEVGRPLVKVGDMLRRA